LVCFVRLLSGDPWFDRFGQLIPDNAVVYLARRIGIELTEITFYDFTDRTSKAHRTQIREALGFRECGD